jgi:hypothetical protein
MKITLMSPIRRLFKEHSDSAQVAQLFVAEVLGRGSFRSQPFSVFRATRNPSFMSSPWMRESRFLSQSLGNRSRGETARALPLGLDAKLPVRGFGTPLEAGIEKSLSSKRVAHGPHMNAFSNRHFQGRKGWPKSLSSNAANIASATVFELRLSETNTS